MTKSTRSRPRVAAFFDMDKTLIAENSGAIYMKHRYEAGEIDGLELARQGLVYLRYKLGALDVGAWSRTAMAGFEGQTEEDLRASAAGFLDAVVETIYPEARERIEWHRKQGHLVAIVSGSTRYVVEPIAAHLGVEHSIFTRLEVRDGRLTGRVVEPLCFEAGKIHWLRRLVEAECIDLAKSWFYTDSITDLPLLEIVGHPVATNPDPRLYREARRRSWPIRIFRQPGPTPAEAAPQD